MSQAFLSGVAKDLSSAEVMVDRFHIVQTFTKTLDDLRKKERRKKRHPKTLGWAVLKNLDKGNPTAKHITALQELFADQ